MKLTSRLRRPADEAPAGTPAPPPGPPRGAPVAAYAGILDGHTLWLAIEAAPGTLALRDAAGEVHPLPSDLAEHDPAYRDVRADLLGLPGEDETAYDVVLVPTGGRAPRLVWVAPFQAGPTRVPPSPDGRWQLGLGRTDEGMLRVRRSRPAPGLDVVDLTVTEDGIRITLPAGDPDDPDDADHADDPAELRLVEDDAVLAAYPIARDGDRRVAVLTEAALPEGTGQLGRLLVGDLPLRRRANDLVNPNQAVLLPALFGDDPDLARLRLRWSPEGHLVGRIVDRNEGEE
ncbi:hypothetical protein [Nocardioides sp.]|uniref:hypothetical protein n=1 Tax=Nocardioides sp. TaxID=35761 RepID=UPI00262D1821|nr:hypothetical protein [Nocardioides sp.]MDI6909162.1 hypothetical protein [Nocardioides sp.]